MTMLEERVAHANQRVPVELNRLCELIEPLSRLASPPGQEDTASRIELLLMRELGTVTAALNEMTRVLSDIRNELTELNHGN